VVFKEISSKRTKSVLQNARKRIPEICISLAKSSQEAYFTEKSCFQKTDSIKTQKKIALPSDAFTFAALR